MEAHMVKGGREGWGRLRRMCVWGGGVEESCRGIRVVKRERERGYGKEGDGECCGGRGVQLGESTGGIRVAKG